MADSHHLLALLLVFLSCQPPCIGNEDELPRIAIVGAGIGGTSSAYYLRELFGPKAVIDVYEPEQVGGRLATIVIDGKEYEAGGTVIHPRNVYMVNFTRMFGLKPREKPNYDTLGIFDGNKFTFQTSSWKPITYLSALWRYGFDIHNINKWVDDIVKKFERIYAHQCDGIAFTTVDELLQSMHPSLLKLTKLSLKELLMEKGYSDRFIDEVVMALTENNYGQSSDIHAFVGSISLAGAQTDVWAVDGGNRRVPEELLKRSKANLKRARVEKIILNKEEGSTVQYELEYVLKNQQQQDVGSKIYDVVVIAIPLNQNVKENFFEDFPHPLLRHYSQPYHRTVASFSLDGPNASFFGLDSMEEIPSSILVSNQSFFFNSLGKVYPVSDIYSRTAWKVFSKSQLNAEQLQLLLKQKTNTKFVDWLAYPKYLPKAHLIPFVLHDQLYYVNAIELAASAMETSVIGGRNVALLAYNHWYNHLDKIDEVVMPEDTEKEYKKEL